MFEIVAFGANGVEPLLSFPKTGSSTDTAPNSVWIAGIPLYSSAPTSGVELFLVSPSISLSNPAITLPQDSTTERTAPSICKLLVPKNYGYANTEFVSVGITNADCQSTSVFFEDWL